MYDQIAHFYDLIHSGLKEDLRFLIKLAAKTDDPILELGCGTGRLLLSLSRVGHRATGIDNSTTMLAIAREKLANESDSVRERISLVDGDITTFSFEQRFGLVILPYNTMFHLDRADRRRCFKCVHDHLRPGGLFVIDIDNPAEIADPAEDGILLLERTMMAPDSDQLIVQMSSSWVDAGLQQRHMTWIFDASPAAGGAINRTVVTTLFHYLNAHEFEDELRSAGLLLKSLYGDYDGGPFGEQSPRLLVIAENLA